MRGGLLMGVLLLALSSTAQAEDAPPRVIPTFPVSCSASPYGVTCLHAFGGAPTRIPLPPDYGKECAGAHVQLYQLSTRLAAPVGNPVALVEKNCNSVVLPLPEVRSTTVFRVSLLKAKVPQDVLVQVYPNDLWTDLQTWSASHHLVVNDRDHLLTPTLERQQITYGHDVLSSENKSKEQICVWVPRHDEADDGEEPFACASLLVLHEKSKTVPYVEVRKEPSRIRTDVYMPILNALDDNPLVQELFVRLIKSQL